MYVTRFFIFHFFIFRAQLWFFFSRNRGLHFLLLLYVKKEKKKRKANRRGIRCTYLFFSWRWRLGRSFIPFFGRQRGGGAGVGGDTCDIHSFIHCYLPLPFFLTFNGKSGPRYVKLLCGFISLELCSFSLSFLPAWIVFGLLLHFFFSGSCWWIARCGC